MMMGLKKLGLSLCALMLSLLFFELGYRVITKDFNGGNRLNMHLDLLRSALPAQHDARLGWVPQVGFSGTNNAWRTQVTIAENGLRINGSAWSELERPDAPRVLAVGDSFTFGDQVSDDESWPSYLQDRLQVPVYNGGVFAYGVDQMFLRAERLLPQLKPDLLIFSFIREDVFRTELIEQVGVNKPYFQIDAQGELGLYNIPVPEPQIREVGLLRRIGGYSAALHAFMSRFCRSAWLQGLAKETHIHYRGEDVTCLLLQRLEQMAAAHDTKLLILMQYGHNQHEAPYATKLMDRLKGCVDPRQTRVLDLKTALAEAKKRDPKGFDRLYNNHMTARGNALVASSLEGPVRELLGLVPADPLAAK